MPTPLSPDFELDIERVQYELERFHARITFAPETLQHIRATSYVDHTTGYLTQELIGIVATWRRERVLKVPANWWEHFKQRWYPGVGAQAMAGALRVARRGRGFAEGPHRATRVSHDRVPGLAAFESLPSVIEAGI